MKAKTPAKAEQVIESVHECDKLRSRPCGYCAKKELTEKSVGRGLNTKIVCKNCGSKKGSYK